MIQNPKKALDYFHWAEVKTAVNNEIRTGRIATLSQMKDFIMSWAETPYFSQERLNKAIMGTSNPDGSYTGGFVRLYQFIIA